MLVGHNSLKYTVSSYFVLKTPCYCTMLRLLPVYAFVYFASMKIVAAADDLQQLNHDSVLLRRRLPIEELKGVTSPRHDDRKEVAQKEGSNELYKDLDWNRALDGYYKDMSVSDDCTNSKKSKKSTGKHLSQSTKRNGVPFLDTAEHHNLTIFFFLEKGKGSCDDGKGKSELNVVPLWFKSFIEYICDRSTNTIFSHMSR